MAKKPRLSTRRGKTQWHHREDAHDPLHDTRKVLSLMGIDDHVEVLPHEANRVHGKAIPLSCALQDGYEELFHHAPIHDHFTSIRPGHHMIPGALHDAPWFPHSDTCHSYALSPSCPHPVSIVTIACTNYLHNLYSNSPPAWSDQ